MPDPARVLLLSADPSLAPELGALVRAAGGELGALPAPDAPRPAQGWTAVLVDERTLGLEALAWAQRVGNATAWLSPEPRGQAAARAHGAGADAVLALPLWAPEARAVLGRLLELSSLRTALSRHRDREESSEVQVQAYAAQLEASQQNLRELYGELEDHARDLRALLAAQQALIPLQAPGKLRRRIEDALGLLFPGARVEVRVAATGRVQHPPQGAVEGAAEGWTRAVVALKTGSLSLGELEVCAAHGAPYPRRRLDLLQVYAREAALALHRSQLYQDLSLGKAEWERTFDTIRDCISVVGPDLELRRVNRALAEAVGKAPQDLVGQPCFRALYGHEAPCPACPVREALETGTQARAQTETVRGSRVYDYRAYPLRGTDGLVYAAIAYARDVTREEQLSRSLRHSEKLVTLGQIAAGIAHEINNPLTAVSSYAQLLALRLGDPRDAESARRIQEGIERIHRLVENLMSFARPSDDAFFPIDLNDIVADTLSFSRYEISRGETELREELAPRLPRVLGSKDQLEHLLVNLLTNARDAVAGRGTVCVATRADGPRVYLEVSDDGVGIASAVRDRVFDPFFTSKPPGKGTGLGLFIAAGIARKHGGELQVDSEPGRGSRFTLTLPAFTP
ncbi:MAG: ATP-binding protein [Thermodesulfobacteriota bacterium]